MTPIDSIHREPDQRAGPQKNVAWSVLPRKHSSGCNLSVMVQRFEPGGWFDEHRHDLEQFFYVATGAMEMTIGGRTRVYQAGQFIRIERDVAHSGRAIGQTPAELVIVDYWPPDSKDRIGLDP